MIRTVLFFIVLGVAFSVPVMARQDQAPGPQDTLAPVLLTTPDMSVETAKLQNYLNSTSSLTATFDSVLLDAERRESGASTGTVYIKKPGMFRWEYQTPSPSIVLADGVRLWSYDEELEQAIVRKLSDYRGANPTLLLGGEADVTDSFTLQKSYSTPEVEWLELIPKDDTSDFTKVRLGFQNEVIYLMELFDRLEQVTRIRFTDVHTNVEIDDALFVFVRPANVDLVGEEN